MPEQLMYAASERICDVHSFLQRIPNILYHTPPLKELMLRFRYYPLHVLPHRDIQPFLRFEELLQFLLLQKISCIAYEDAIEIYYLDCKHSVVMHIPWGKEDVLRLSCTIAYPVKLESVEPALRRLTSSCYRFLYSLLIYIVVLAYRYISRVYKMLLVPSTFQFLYVVYSDGANSDKATVMYFR
jgi:hypothetical protein